MFKCAATNPNTQPTVTQQRLTCAVKNARLLSDGFCCLSDKGNEILFRINISLPLTTVAGLDGVGQWLGLPGHRTTDFFLWGHTKALIYTSPFDSEEDLFACIVEVAATWHF